MGGEAGCWGCCATVCCALGPEGLLACEVEVVGDVELREVEGAVAVTGMLPIAAGGGSESSGQPASSTSSGKPLRAISDRIHTGLCRRFTIDLFIVRAGAPIGRVPRSRLVIIATDPTDPTDPIDPIGPIDPIDR